MTSVVKRSVINLPDAALSRIYKAIIRRHLDYAITNNKSNNESFKFSLEKVQCTHIIFSHIVLANRISLRFQ